MVGDQFLQPDCNLPTEKAWREQFAHGRRYFSDRFGTRSTVAFNVDSFGHPATLPDILAGEGYTGYVIHRPNEAQVSLPAAAFRWRGSGGGEVMGFRIAPAYVTRTDDLYGQLMLAIETADPALGHTMCFYGVGNHGGGPTKGNIEWIMANRDFEGHELRFSSPQIFFDTIAAQREQLPLVEEELQHVFPGCYSVMHDIKQQQRHGELLLERAEQVADVFAAGAERDALLQRVDQAWPDLLFTEFHDILSGTSIPSAWGGVRAMQGRAWITGEEVIYDATRRWARRTLPGADFQQIAVVNPGPQAWSGIVEAEPWLEFDIWDARWLSTPDGQPVDFQQVQPEAQQGVNRVLFPADVPAGGAVQVLVRDDPAPEHQPETDLDVSAIHLANSRIRVDLERGCIGDITVDGRSLLGKNGIRLHLRQDSSDTWGFVSDRFEEPVSAVFEDTGWVIEEIGPLRARMRTEGWLGHSWIRWTLSLHRNDPRLQMQIEVNFAERYTLLQMPIDLAATPAVRVSGATSGSGATSVRGGSAARTRREGEHLGRLRDRHDLLGADAGGDDRDPDLAVEIVVERRAPDDVGVGIDQLADMVGGLVDLHQPHVVAAGDRDDHALGALHADAVEQADWRSPARPPRSRDCRRPPRRCPSSPCPSRS